MIVTLLLQMLAAGIACTAFSVVFNAPKKELVYCGICGGVGWGVMFLINRGGGGAVVGTLCSAIAVTALARFLSYARKAPSTMYHIAGILPLVPGMSMYNSMWGILNDDMMYSYMQAVNVIRLAGMIGIGSIIVLALPYSVFEIGKPRVTDTPPPSYGEVIMQEEEIPKEEEPSLQEEEEKQNSHGS
ncbi:MAG: threonine/serine exporter [Epulopiscium sp.]|jgi:uncharacterized membrane protein YjjB (DUF3815 family)|nr:threonine/serine exporter [Candidatus Epulonipiscium sp.]